jgi:signal transduction histidine kinase
VTRLPPWARSVRLRLTLLYSGVLFGLAALLVASLYLGLSLSLRGGGELERQVHEQALANLRAYSFGALGALFAASLVVGWTIAGHVLRPIDRIASVAREIQATSLSRRIALEGPDDELTRLAGAFDEMLARLDAAFASQRRFLADASHELRNPLAIVRTNAALTLAEPGAGDDVRRRAGRIDRAAERMSGLVEDLLSLARLEAPATRVDAVDLAALVAEVGDELLAPAAARGVELRWDAAGGIVLFGDRAALKRALANLVDNAVRHARGRVSIGAGGRRGSAWVSVSDDGPGIAPEHRERIFDRFYRIDPARSRANGGAGLGLTIAREIAESHRGEIRVDSAPGEGATFVLRLPLP